MNRREFLKVAAVSPLFFPMLSSADSGYSYVAKYFRQEGENVICELCPHECVMIPNDRGLCGVRGNLNGQLQTYVYQTICRKSEAKIETLPLYHFMPGLKVLTVATPGCNMDCPYCNTSAISQFRPEDVPGILTLTPEALVKEALKFQLGAIAFTYTEPIIAYEWVLETAKIAKAQGIHVLLVTNGLIQEKPLRELAPYLSACKIDLKSIREESYQHFLKGELKTVLRSIEILQSFSVWLELYLLVVEGLNESAEEVNSFCKEVKQRFGNVPLFFGRFFPSYKMNQAKTTSLETLHLCEKIAKQAHFHYVYLANVEERSSTFCPQCQKEVIRRAGGTETSIEEYHLIQGKCPSCQFLLPGVWENI